MDLKKDTFPTCSFFRNSDGRFLNEHKKFFDELRLKHQGTPLVITTFGTNTSGDHERSLAQRLLDQHAVYPNAPILVETGVMHARKLPYSEGGGKETIPMAMYLEAELNTASLFLRYRSGEVVVEGKRHNITDAASQIEGPGDAFDYELVIDRATPDREFS